MRTTLDLDEDVLQAAKELARRRRTTLGRTVSDLARGGLNATPSLPHAAEPPSLHGFRPFASRGGVVTNERIDRLREDDAY